MTEPTDLQTRPHVVLAGKHARRLRQEITAHGCPFMEASIGELVWCGDCMDRDQVANLLDALASAGVVPAPPSEACLKKYVTCDADEGGPEAWCGNCRSRLEASAPSPVARKENMKAPRYVIGGYEGNQLRPLVEALIADARQAPEGIAPFTRDRLSRRGTLGAPTADDAD